MKMHPTLYRIEKAWKWRIYAKIAAWLAILVGFSIGLVWLLSVSVVIASLLGLLAIVIGFWEWKSIPKQQDIIHLVNSQLHSSEYSTELVFDTTTQGIISLQREKVLKALDQKIPELQFPVNWKSPIVAFAVGSLILLVGWFWPQTIPNEALFEGQNELGSVAPIQKDTTYLEDAYVMVTPPSYSKLRKSKSELNLDVLEQSKLQWIVSFVGIPNAVWITTSQGDSLPLGSNGNEWRVFFNPKESGFYSLIYSTDKEVVTSPYYPLKLIPDEVPEARIIGIPQHQRLDYEKGLSVDFSVSLSDDFGLTDGFIVATITKGSGESVMFREQKIPLPMAVKGKKLIVPMTLRPDDFGMEPGNELYFYATAFDNREPTIQRSRTETYFFILKDTAEVTFSLEGSLGVDLMPDFFRSQLQIIIDTEKLLEYRTTLPKKEFNQESNALGFDQKQLRLKYGQFIGEEEDSGLEVETEGPEEVGEVAADGSNVLQEFGHDHDHENEAGQLMDKGTEPAEEKSKNPLQAYMHEHGDEETATFHTQTLKAKLRAALTEMWDAELYLRLFQPEKSLPYQYRAQELLKEIKNHARIYVQRIGFDPPPVNEAESRLTGKMKQLNEGSFKEIQEDEQDYPSIRKSIAMMDEVMLNKNWTEKKKDVLREAGNELAGLAIQQPGQYLDALNTLKILLDKRVLNTADVMAIKELKKVLEKVVTEENPVPAGANYSMDEMNTHFLKGLLKSNGTK